MGRVGEVREGDQIMDQLSIRYYMDNQLELKYYMTKEVRKLIESYLSEYKHLNSITGDLRSISHVIRWIINQD